ncbi:FKBP-type peptidyl-prolyl cis-trans isomerase [Mucilaginibacter sp. AW1-3]
MKNFVSLVNIALAVSLIGCNSPSQNKIPNPNVNIIESKGNEKIRLDDMVWLTYQVKTSDGNIVYSNYDHVLFRQSSDFKGDLFESLGSLAEGDSAVVKVSIDSMAAKKQVMPANLTGKYLEYDIRVNKVVTRQGAPGRTSDSLMNAAIENTRKQIAESDKSKEEVRLNQYIINNHLLVRKTPSGLYYSIIKTGNGPKPEKGDLSEIYFTGRYIDGETFFTNNLQDAKMAGIYDAGKQYQPLEMYIGKSFFIPGLEDGLLMMPAGTKATLIIPSKLSNGYKYGFVPLVCTIEVVNIRHPKPNEKIKMLHQDHSEERTL